MYTHSRCKGEPAMKQNTTSGQSPQQAPKQSLRQSAKQSSKQTSKQSPKQSKKICEGPITIGIDLGDKTSRYCLLNNRGEVVKEASVAMTKKGLAQAFGTMKRCRIVLEVGTHSPWVSRLLTSLGHEVFVANPRQLKLIRREQPERRSRRCDHAGAAAAGRPGAVAADPASQRSNANGLDGDPRAGGAG